MTGGATRRRRAARSVAKFSDEVERLRRAIAYLGRHPGVECSFELSPRPWRFAAAV